MKYVQVFYFGYCKSIFIIINFNILFKIIFKYLFFKDFDYSRLLVVYGLFQIKLNI